MHAEVRSAGRGDCSICGIIIEAATAREHGDTEDGLADLSHRLNIGNVCMCVCVCVPCHWCVGDEHSYGRPRSAPIPRARLLGVAAVCHSHAGAAWPAVGTARVAMHWQRRSWLRVCHDGTSACAEIALAQLAIGLGASHER